MRVSANGVRVCESDFPNIFSGDYGIFRAVSHSLAGVLRLCREGHVRKSAIIPRGFQPDVMIVVIEFYNNVCLVMIFSSRVSAEDIPLLFVLVCIPLARVSGGGGALGSVELHFSGRGFVLDVRRDAADLTEEIRGKRVESSHRRPEFITRGKKRNIRISSAESMF